MAPITAPFPSAAWLEELVERATADRTALDRLGIADIRFALEITGLDGSVRQLGLVLDGYDVEAVGDVNESAFGPDVVCSGPLEAWQDMVGWIEAHGPADSAHSLNGLTIAGVPFTLRSPDPMGADKFYRYMGTLQAVFDAAGDTADTAVAAGTA